MRIMISWVQKGHSTRDPVGTRRHHLKATWANVQDEKEADLEFTRAIDYAKAQNHWCSWQVCRSSN